MPTPRKSEPQSVFVARCMSDPEANRDFPETAQRVAFCFSQWEQHHDHGADCGCSHHVADADVELTRQDPTGTTGLRKRFESEMVRRFRKLRALIVRSLVENDALGLRAVTDAAIPRREFQFARTPEKVGLFMAWLREQQAIEVLGIRPGAPMVTAEQAWTATYIESAYQKGIRDAGAKLRKAGAQVAPSWIEEAFSRPVHADRAGLAFTRTFSELEGVTQAMDQQISRVLAEGLAQGKNPMAIARDITNRVEKIGVTRARMIARTETIAAHADATLNSYEEAGIMGVDVEAEVLITLGACPICVGLSQNGPYTMNEARGLLPAHPNCRCALTPVVTNGSEIQLQ